jgi:hypothetical protein
MILPHLSASARVIAASSAGEDDAVSTAMSSIRFTDFGQGQNAADLGIEPTDDLARHSGGTVGGVQETTGTYG